MSSWSIRRILKPERIMLPVVALVLVLNIFLKNLQESQLKLNAHLNLDIRNPIINRMMLLFCHFSSLGETADVGVTKLQLRNKVLCLQCFPVTSLVLLKRHCSACHSQITSGVHWKLYNTNPQLLTVVTYGLLKKKKKGPYHSDFHMYLQN
jgi:hypothetical protein